MKQPKPQQQSQPATPARVEVAAVSSPVSSLADPAPVNLGDTADPGEGGEGLTIAPAMNRLLALQEEMEREKETAVRQIMEEKARLTEAYQATIAKLDALLAKIAPELVAPPAPPAPAVPQVQLPQRVRARAEALAMSAGRTEASAKWNGQKFCPYCQIQGHDGRAHRGQPEARKWSKAELAAFGYLPPAGQPQLPANYDQIVPQAKGQLG